MRDDAALVEAWRGGDAAAGEELFSRYFAGISRFFRNKVSTGVEDLIQQTFVALLEGRERIRSDQSVRSYLFGIAHNVLRAHLRRLRRGQSFDPHSSAIVDLDPSPSTMHAAREEQRLLLLALRRIPLEHQVALELVYWEGLNAAEIAEIVGVPHSTMRSRIQRARALLEQAIAEQSQSPEMVRSTVDGLDRWAAEIRAAAGR